jgi:type I restriction enzyme S subunit
MISFIRSPLKNLTLKIGSGATPTGGDASYKTHGISLIRSQNILDYFFSKDGLAYIDEKQAKELNNVTLQENDVLVNITGDSVARVCQVPSDVLPARVNQHVAILRANMEKLVPAYLKYYLLANPIKERLLSLASTGATRKALTKAMLEEFEIEIPNEEGTCTQTRIASIISSLDDKIALNRRTNHTLEQMAQTLFKKYFVDDIDPENLPEGWKWGKLGELVEITSSKRIFLEEYTQTGIPFFRGKEIIELNKGNPITTEIFISEKKYNEIKAKFEVPIGGDILLTSVGTIGIPFLVPNSEKFYFKDGNLTWFKKCSTKINPYFLYQWLTSEQGQDAIKNITIGSTQQAITIQSLKNIPLIIPSFKLIESVTSHLINYRKLIQSNYEENKYLVQIRNALLPKLMSGEIEIP